MKTIRVTYTIEVSSEVSDTAIDEVAVGPQRINY